MEWIHHSAEAINAPPCTGAWCQWLRCSDGEDHVLGWCMSFSDRGGFYVTRSTNHGGTDNFTPIAGPFDDLDQAKVAYLLIFGGA